MNEMKGLFSFFRLRGEPHFVTLRCRLFGHRWDDSDPQLDWCRRCGNGRLGKAWRV